jgi:hypothetical protein
VWTRHAYLQIELFNHIECIITRSAREQADSHAAKLIGSGNVPTMAFAAKLLQYCKSFLAALHLQFSKQAVHAVLAITPPT